MGGDRGGTEDRTAEESARNPATEGSVKRSTGSAGMRKTMGMRKTIRNAWKNSVIWWKNSVSWRCLVVGSIAAWIACIIAWIARITGRFDTYTVDNIRTTLIVLSFGFLLAYVPFRRREVREHRQTLARIGSAGTDTSTSTHVSLGGAIYSLPRDLPERIPTLITVPGTEDPPPRLVRPTGGIDGPVIGWREWQPALDVLELRSVVQHYTWLAGENTAACYSRHHHLPAAWSKVKRARARRIPHRDHDCGFYAFYQNDNGLTEGLYTEGLWLYGLILGYGKVQWHEEGFRCEKAQILCLVQSEHNGPVRQVHVVTRETTFATHDFQAYLRIIAREYGVPVVTREQAEQLASEWGGA